MKSVRLEFESWEELVGRWMVCRWRRRRRLGIAEVRAGQGRAE
jgi:hypothetical protein